MDEIDKAIVDIKKNMLANPNFIKYAIESILFTSGRSITISEIIEILKRRGITVTSSKVLKYLNQLKEEYDKFQHALKIYEDTDGWRMVTRDVYAPFVEEMTYDSDFSQSVLETLAVIVWKAPVLQSDIIAIRNNKAYDHLNFLEKKGFITREKFGKTYIVKLTDKFFDYFDVESKENFKEKFKERLKKFEEEMKKKEKEKVKSIEPEIAEKEPDEVLVPLGDSGVKVIEAAHISATNPDVLFNSVSKEDSNGKAVYVKGDANDKTLLSGNQKTDHNHRDESIKDHGYIPVDQVGPITPNGNTPHVNPSNSSLSSSEKNAQENDDKHEDSIPEKKEKKDKKNPWTTEDDRLLDELISGAKLEGSDEKKAEDVFNNPMLDKEGKKILDSIEKKSRSDQIKKVVKSVEDIFEVKPDEVVNEIKEVNEGKTKKSENEKSKSKENPDDSLINKITDDSGDDSK